jgi:hypothetical protein
MAYFKNYDPARIIVVFNGVQLQGYADGTFVKCARDEDAFTSNVGAAGDVVRVRNRNRMGTVTVTLQDASPSNDLLSGMAQTDESTGLAYGALMVKDLNGTTLIQAAAAWIKKTADVEFAKEQGNQEWVISASELIVFSGGELV